MQELFSITKDIIIIFSVIAPHLLLASLLSFAKQKTGKKGLEITDIDKMRENDLDKIKNIQKEEEKKKSWQGKIVEKLQDFQKKKKKKKEDKAKPVTILLDFQGDMFCSARKHLEKEVELVLAMKPAPKAVILKLSSPGGAAHTYGSAAAMLDRLRLSDIHLTICVDEVAASGGYMMACTANRLCASPNAFVGSIGVRATVPNFHELEKNVGVEHLEFQSGKNKLAISSHNPNSPEKIEHFQKEMDELHDGFKQWVQERRTNVKDEVFEAGCWTAAIATQKGFGLVDEIITSAEVIERERQEGRKILEMKYNLPGNQATGLLSILHKILNRYNPEQQTRYHF